MTPRRHPPCGRLMPRARRAGARCPVSRSRSGAVAHDDPYRWRSVSPRASAQRGSEDKHCWVGLALRCASRRAPGLGGETCPSATVSPPAGDARHRPRVGQPPPRRGAPTPRSAAVRRCGAGRGNCGAPLHLLRARVELPRTSDRAGWACAPPPLPHAAAWGCPAPGSYAIVIVQRLG
jgi:hypothetical protein